MTNLLLTVPHENEIQSYLKKKKKKKSVKLLKAKFIIYSDEGSPVENMFQYFVGFHLVQDILRLGSQMIAQYLEQSGFGFLEASRLRLEHDPASETFTSIL